jgi:hypothetical protein
MNAGNTVQKASPEEQAVIANLGALITELQSMGGAAPMGGEPDGDEAAGMNPGVMKGNEMGRQEGADTVMQPGAKPKQQGMAPWDSEDDEVKKAWATVAKAIQASDTDSATARDSGEERTEELPEVDEKNVNEVAKALARMLGKKGVAKSMGSAQSPAPGIDLSPIVTVLKSMAEKQARTDAILGEVLEGLGAANAFAAPEQTVQKSQNNAPYAGLDGGNMIEVIATAVAKSLAMAGNFQQSNSGIPVAKGFTRTDNDQALRGLTEGIVQIAGDKWGNHQAPEQ